VPPGALSLSLQVSDRHPGRIEDLGFLDDAFVLRVAVASGLTSSRSFFAKLRTRQSVCSDFLGVGIRASSASSRASAG